MSDKLLWFLVGAGALLLLGGKSGGAGLGGGLSISVGGNVNAHVPPDQRWNTPSENTERIGVWNPDGLTSTFRDVVPDSHGNRVMVGGGYN